MAEEARMNAELEESVQRTYEKASDIRPAHTSRAYKGKQCEFKQWCSDKGPAFNDLTRFTVTGPKLHLLLEECVIGRDKRRKGQDRTEKIGRATVNSYVAAMVDLWRQQQRLKINNHPSPRDGAVSALLKITDYEENDRRRKNFDDRGANTMLDGYTTTEQIQKIARFFWMASREPGTSLRNLLAFLLSHYALMRGEFARRMELADLHSIQLENEGYTSCRALVMVMRQGKTNQVGRIEVGATMRNKCAQICPHGLLGFYLFWRWHVELEPFPDFTTSEKWYPVKLLKTGKDPTKEMSYKVHRDAIAGALDHIGLRSRAKTHVGRGSGARMADLGGASEAQIRRLGRWNNQAMEKCYLTSLPREAMRTLAGFEPTRGGFFLDRATIEPPESLQQLVFPAVEEWQAKMTSGACEQSIAGGGFLELLQYLRVVLLQDAVVLQEEMPFHPIWKHPIFQSDEYSKFKGYQHEALRNVVHPTEQQLEKAMPLLKSKIDSVHHDLKTSVAGVQRQMESIDGNLAGVLKVLAPFSNGSALLQVKIVDGTDTVTPTPPVSASSTAEDLASPVVHTGIPTYKMSRGIQTVPELWNEWEHGLSGGLAVKLLEKQFGTKWCSNLERRFFNRRRKIIDVITKKTDSICEVESVDRACALEKAVENLEEIRRSRRKTLNWLSLHAAEVERDLDLKSTQDSSLLAGW